MPWVKLEGWPLEDKRGHGRLNDEDKSHVYLNTEQVVSLMPAARGDRSGYLLHDSQGEVWFLDQDEAATSQMVQGWVPTQSA